jgi:hypothetical protein
MDQVKSGAGKFEMKQFKVYPKDGEMFSLKFESFEIKEDGFVLYDAVGTKTTNTYLSFENVAAILPEPLPRYNSSLGLDPVTFLVYLKNRPQKEPLITLTADGCDTSTPPSARFLIKEVADDQVKDREIPSIYIALSEVVMIAPSDRLS